MESVEQAVQPAAAATTSAEAQSQPSPSPESIAPEQILDVPYTERGEAFNLGARFNRDLKKYIMPADGNPADFAKWLPGAERQQPPQSKTERRPFTPLSSTTRLPIGEARAAVVAEIDKQREALLTAEGIQAEVHQQILTKLQSGVAHLNALVNGGIKVVYVEKADSALEIVKATSGIEAPPPIERPEREKTFNYQSWWNRPSQEIAHDFMLGVLCDEMVPSPLETWTEIEALSAHAGENGSERLEQALFKLECIRRRIATIREQAFQNILIKPTPADIEAADANNDPSLQPYVASEQRIDPLRELYDHLAQTLILGNFEIHQELINKACETQNISRTEAENKSQALLEQVVNAAHVEPMTIKRAHGSLQWMLNYRSYPIPETYPVLFSKGFSSQTFHDAIAIQNVNTPAKQIKAALDSLAGYRTWQAEQRLKRAEKAKQNTGGRK